MDQNAEALWRIKLGKIAEKLKLNQMDAYIVQSKEELPALLDRLMRKGATVNAGGSMTLAETGILDYLNEGDYVFYDKTSPEVKTNEQIAAVNRQAFPRITISRRPMRLPRTDGYTTSTAAATASRQ